MTNGRQTSFGFERNKPGTDARTEAEKSIETLRQDGGVFVEAVARTRMPMALTDARLPGNPIVFVNQAFLHHSGYSMREVLGQHPHFMNGPATDPSDASRFREAVRRGEDIVVETWQYRKDGSRFFAAVLVSPIRGDTGEVIQHFLSFLDITRRAEAEQALRDHVATLEETVAIRTEALRLSEERQSFLLKLSDALRPVTSPIDVQRVAGRILRQQLGADRVGYAEIEADEDTTRLMVGDRVDGAGPLSKNSYRWSDLDPVVHKRLKQGKSVSRDDIQASDDLTPEQKAAFDAVHSRAFIAVPLLKDGRLVACITVHFKEPQACTRENISLVEETAERTWAEVQRVRAETALRESEARFRALVTAGTLSIYRMSSDWKLMYQLDSQSLAETAEPIENWVEKYIPESDLPAVRAAIGTAIRTKSLFELEHRVWTADGSIGWVLSRAVPLLGEDGEIIEWFGAGTVVTERHAAAERQRLLLGELQHRVRNTLGVVRSIARRTALTSESVEEMAAHLDGRIDAFARVQAMVTRRPEGGVDLATLIEDELRAHAAREGEKIRVSGMDVLLKAKPAETLSLAIHELTTNAVKHGALAQGGWLAVRWTVADGRLRLVWEERGSLRSHRRRGARASGWNC